MSADQTTYLNIKFSTFESHAALPAFWNLHTAHISLLLHIEESDSIRIPEEQHTSASIEDLVAVRSGHLLGHLVLQVLHHKTVRLIQHSKAVASNPDSREATASLPLRCIRTTRVRIFGDGVKVVSGVFSICVSGAKQNSVFSRIVSHRVDWSPACSQLHHSSVPVCGQVEFPEIFLLHIVQQVASERMGRTFTFQLEDDHASIVPGGKEIKGGMTSDHPESVILPSKCVETRALGHVPDSYALVLAVAQDKLLSWVEDGTADIVVVASARVHLPSLEQDSC